MKTLKNYAYEKIHAHFGHHIVAVAHGDEDNPENVAIECEDCGAVLFSCDKEPEEETGLAVAEAREGCIHD